MLWKCICSSLGFPSFAASCFLWYRNTLSTVLRSFANILLGFSTWLRILVVASMLMSLSDSLKMRGLLPFSAVIRTVFVSKSMCARAGERFRAGPLESHEVDLVAIAFKEPARTDLLMLR